MLIKFDTDSYPPILMFDYVGKNLIKLMGHSGTVPSAINATGVSDALDNLESALNKEIEVNAVDHNDNDEEYHVDLKKRAIPLIELLQSAEANEDGVMWDFAYS